MLKEIVRSFSKCLHGMLSSTPPGMGPCAAAAWIEGGKYFKAFRSEVESVLIMMLCTFSIGNWFLKGDGPLTKLVHGLGVCAVDYFGTGGHLNAAVTVSFVCLNKNCSYTEGYVRIAGQIIGGMIAFPFFHAVANLLNLPPFGGPGFVVSEHDSHATEAFLNEFFATFLLMFVIFITSWEMEWCNFAIKRVATAIFVRAILELCPASGPAMNPSLATAWHVFGVSPTHDYPKEFSHYFVYWVSPIVASLLASAFWLIYEGGTFCGMSLPMKPLKMMLPVRAKVA